MKALTIKPKWANMILDGRKTIEVRTWVTRYRGPLAIHSGSPVCAIVAVCNLVAVRAMREADVSLTGGVEFHELLVAFPGGDGTADCVRKDRAAGIEVLGVTA